MFGKTEEKFDSEFFAIFDSKVGTYRQPITADNSIDACRSYESIVRNHPIDALVTNAEDFQLFSIGGYKKSSGQIESWKPRHVANLHEIKAQVLKKDVQKPSVALSST